MSKKNKNTEMESLSSMVPVNTLGSDIMNAAKQQIRNEVQALVLKQVAALIVRRDNLVEKRRVLAQQAEHINKQVNAIETNQFVVNRGKIIFNNARLNQDPATVYPFHNQDYTMINPEDI